MASGPPDIVIEVLGRFRVAIRGRAVPQEAWRGRRAAELVQLLALAPEREVLRDQAIEALWPQLDADAGAANLRKAAHHARQALGEADAVALRGGRVQLFPGTAVVVDATTFERNARVALDAGEPERCRQVATAYPGVLLPGSLYEEWTLAPRARLQGLHLDLLRAAGEWTAVVEREPTDEAAYRELMRQALDEGRRAAAIRWYGRMRTALARELGVSPDAESERMYEACIADLRPSGVVLVGRQAELATFEHVLDATGPDRVCGIALRGPAGIGKSALCRELVATARRRGRGVVSVDATDTAEPFAVIRSLIESLLPADPPLVERVGAHAASVLASLTPVAGPPPVLDGPLSRHQVVGTVRRVLLAASNDQPLLLVVDDAHVADDASLEVLLHLLSPMDPFVLVVAHRPQPGRARLERTLSRLVRAGRAVAVELGPLPEADVAHLVALAADEVLEPDVTDRIVELAAGNPFTAVELARSRAADPGRLPASVGEAITARLVDLDADAVAVLKRLALASDDLDSATVVALTGGTEEHAFAVLDRALAGDVLVVVGNRYRFRHDLVRQALVDQVAPHERLAVHRDAARRLAAAGAPPATVARHWLAGGRPDEAVEPLLLAAGQAIGLGAFTVAIETLDLLLEHEPNHAVALRLRAEALDAIGDVSTVAAYDAAIAPAAGDEAHDLRAKRALAQLKQGDPVGAVESLEGVHPVSTDAQLAEALTFSGAAALGYIEPSIGTAKSAECRKLALESGDTAAIVVASWAQAAAAHARGQLRESVLADMRDTSEVPHLAVRVFDGQLCVTQRLLYGARPYPDVIAFADSLASEATRLGSARGAAFGVTLRGEAELLSGQLQAAEVHLREGARLHHVIAGPTGEALALQRLSELALCRGDRGLATALLDEALDLARATDIGFHLLDRIYGTRIALAASSEEAALVVEEAEEAVRGPLETCPGCRITFAVPAAIAAANAGDLGRAAEYEGAVAFLADVVMRLPAWAAAHEEVLGHVARAEGDQRRAARAFAAAAARFAAAGHPLDQLRCEALRSV